MIDPNIPEPGQVWTARAHRAERRVVAVTEDNRVYWERVSGPGNARGRTYVTNFRTTNTYQKEH